MEAQPSPEADAFKKKMVAAGLSDAFIKQWLALYADLQAGSTGMIPESTISPVETLPSFDDIQGTAARPELLKETVVLKLNGGLGTSMGLEKAKSLLKVKGEMTFLDVLAKQVLHLKKQQDVKFMLMNSFSTSDDTMGFFRSNGEYSPLVQDTDFELVQNKAPKIDAASMNPVDYPANASLEWCPPGHGDLYAALMGSGKLDSLLAKGYKYMFVSNSDNLGATMDLSLLTYFAAQQAPMLMECCRRTPADKKGGHLAKTKDGQLILRESAQCDKSDEAAFQDINRHKFFNTNNLWLNLPMLKDAIDRNGGFLPLPIIKNSKTVDPRDASSPSVIQLETAMGAAIASLPGSAAIVVPTSRFFPVKSCDQLFAIRSDAYQVADNGNLELADKGRAAPVVTLDSKLYKLVDQMETLAPEGVPSLRDCSSLTVQGKVVFGKGVVVTGDTTVKNTKDAALVVDKSPVTGEVTDETLAAAAPPPAAAPAAPATFTVVLKKSSPEQKYGFTNNLDKATNSLYVGKIIDTGLMYAYNQTAPQDKKILVGMTLASVNGSTDPKTMRDSLVQESTVTLVLQPKVE